MSSKLLIFIVYALFLVSGCQKRFGGSPSADPLALSAKPPMGSNTHNNKLKKELELLDSIIEKEANSLNKLDKLWLKARHLFTRRRFVESSMLLTDILKERPLFHEARNWRARAVFFLGNPQMAISELDFIIKNNPSEEEKLDALYLKGAFVFEMEDANEDQLKNAITSWQSYLKHQDLDEKMRAEVSEGLVGLISRSKKDKILPPELAKIQEVRLTEARGFIQAGKISAALEAFLSLVKDFPKYPAGYHYLGMAHMMAGEPGLAIKAWAKTIELDARYASDFNLADRIKIAQGMLETKKVESH